jgi:hypothetical protein
MKKMMLIALVVMPFLANADRELRGRIDDACMEQSKVFDLVAFQSSQFYPDKDTALKQADKIARKFNKEKPNLTFARSVTDEIFRNSAMRRLFRDSPGLDFAWSYYQNCLEEPENYLSDYNSIKTG